MIKKINIEDGVGQALLHDITGILSSGFKGVVFPRGHIVTEADIPALKKIGKNHIFVGELEPGQVHEEDAARELVANLAHATLTHTKPSEGKITLCSKVPGVLVLNEEAVYQLNAGDFKLVTLPNLYPVQAEQSVAALRIVPLWTSQEEVDYVASLAKCLAPVIQVKPYQEAKVGILITGSEVYHGLIEDSFEPVLRKKLAAFPADILKVVKCPDEEDFLENVARELLAAGADILIFSGGMSVDPDDITPSMIRKLSDDFICQGVPMQPGNMLTLGRHKQTMLIGVPGASIHSPTTSFDVYLPRIFARLPISAEDIQRSGVGGLCQKCTVCAYPRCYFGY